MAKYSIGKNVPWRKREWWCAVNLHHFCQLGDTFTITYWHEYEAGKVYVVLKVKNYYFLLSR